MDGNPSYEQLWAQCLRIIANNVSNEQFNTWFRPVSCAGFDEEERKVTLVVPSSFVYEWIEEHYIDLLGKVLNRVFGSNVRLMYRVLKDKTHGITSDLRSEPLVHTEGGEVRVVTRDIPQVPDSVSGRCANLPPLESHLMPNLTFESFVEGDSNKMPLAVARSIAQNPDQQNFNPLFVYGHTGVGKTHLANAIGLRCKQIHPDKRVLYVSAHLFQTQFVDAQMRDNRVNDFIRFYQTIDVLIVDDVQEFQGMKGTINAFFNIFNHLRMNGKQIILTCDRPPVELRDISDRMLSRFKWGLQCEIEQPTQQLRYNILRDKMLRDGLAINDDVIRYVADNISDSVRDLEGIINSLMAHSVCLGREIDMSMAQMVVSRAVRVERQPVTIDRIVQGVCEAFNVTNDDLMSSSRKANIAQARQIVMYLAARMTDLSSTRIGLLMGKRSHATVLHSIKQAENLMIKNPVLHNRVEDVRGALLSRV